MCRRTIRSKILRKRSAPSASRSITAPPKIFRWRGCSRCLFEVTGLFDMRTRPELILLQKTMVVVEGVARSLDPKLDMWSTAEPVVREWMTRNLGPAGKLEGAAQGMSEIGRFISNAPGLLTRGARLLNQLDDITHDGLVLSPQTLADIDKREGRRSRWSTDRLVGDRGAAVLDHHPAAAMIALIAMQSLLLLVLMDGQSHRPAARR